MSMKIERWNGHKIRFVYVNNEWYAVAKDVAEALGYAETRNMMKLVPSQYTVSCKLDDSINTRILVSEFGIYKAVFGSHKPEAEVFQEWVFEVIKELRQSSGLEGFQVFRMLDKEHQKEEMRRLSQAFIDDVPVNHIVANTIANKAIANKYGLSKMISKSEMSSEMLADRQTILSEIIDLMIIREKYGLKFSVSEKIYNRLSGMQTA